MDIFGEIANEIFIPDDTETYIFRPKTKYSLRNALLNYNNNKYEAILEYGTIDTWDVSRITDMSGLFKRMNHFNECINNWQTEQVTNMSEMFMNCNKFNNGGNPLTINTDNCENMSGMFICCIKFDNGGNPLVLNTGNCENMSMMFCSCYLLNVHIIFSNTSRVLDMTNMFFGCHQFNNGGNPLILNMDRCENISQMFYSCINLNVEIILNNTSNVINMSCMFMNCDKFNNGSLDIKNSKENPLILTMDNVKDCHRILFGCNSFNRDCFWNLDKVEHPAGLRKLGQRNFKKFNRQILEKDNRFDIFLKILYLRDPANLQSEGPILK